jgi:glycosyltransferase involved in cell wall biosynthesis
MAKLTDIRLFWDVPKSHPLRKYVPADWNPNYPYATDEPMLHLAEGGHSFMPVNVNVWSKTRNVGWAFIEFPETARCFAPHATRYYDHVVASSSWCEQKLREMGLPSVSKAIQGIDFERFHPDVNAPNPSGKFVIYSGGKAELRKGTDIVIAAYKILSQKYKDMHLVASWGNHWLDTMNSMAESKVIKYIPTLGSTWRERLQGTFTLNGISNDRYTLLDMVPNDKVADQYRNCHVGCFLSRCEAGNNMVLCEFMACGRPVVATMETGHSDVVDLNNAYFVSEGKFTTDGWFHAEVKEVAWLIEQAYQHYDVARDIGLKGAESMKKFSWDRCAKDLLSVCGV